MYTYLFDGYNIFMSNVISRAGGQGIPAPGGGKGPSAFYHSHRGDDK